MMLCAIDCYVIKQHEYWRHWRCVIIVLLTALYIYGLVVSWNKWNYVSAVATYGLCAQSFWLFLCCVQIQCTPTSGITLCIRPANERRRYIVTSSLIGWTHTQIDPCAIPISYCQKIRYTIILFFTHRHIFLLIKLRCVWNLYSDSFSFPNCLWGEWINSRMWELFDKIWT